MKLRSTLLTGAATALLMGLALPSKAADTYKVDPVHSTVIFRIKHMNVSYFNGRFDEISGTITLNEQSPAESALDLKLTATSVDTADPKRDQHIKGPDFLNVKQFPAITFKSKQISKNSSGSYDVTGDLTLHGVTKPITVKLEQTGQGRGPRGYVAGFETTFTVKRSDFGMSNMLEMLGDEVRMTVDIEASRP